jgi:ADP-ribose pyrophosphatase YjhB (NUDIX family)
VREETGLEVEVGRLLVVDVRGRAVAFVFECSPAGGILKPGAGEIRALRWLPAADIERLSPRVEMTLRTALLAIEDGPRHLL